MEAVLYLCVCYRNTDTVERIRDRRIGQIYLRMIWACFVRQNFQHIKTKKEEEKDVKYF